ncbi:fimbria/pilus periplasmic chaperone [Escherichia coli]|nr:fimbria/pilus periplasmic chaperone [Escherichia coli]
MLVQSWLYRHDVRRFLPVLQSLYQHSASIACIDAKRANNQINAPTASKDRESVFWFNVLELPPKPDAEKVANQSLLQLAFRTRIKLFYRPEEIPAPARIPEV